MSKNHRMHPKNVFQKEPDFKKLAEKYPKFREHLKLDPAGKLKYNFKDPNALKCLAEVLLEDYFRIKIVIPENALVPTIPLRYNYVLWLEDIANYLNVRDVKVIDIGTGATCIYPLLMAKTKNWRVMATEMNAENFTFALKNVHVNGLENLINVQRMDDSRIFPTLPERFTLCMCNPPFYSDETRSEKQSPPRNAKTGKCDELTTDGGEVAFVERIIAESVCLKDQVSVYTTMLGHKKSLAPVKAAIRRVNATSLVETRFHQGYTTRWAVAWTFLDHVNLKTLSESHEEKDAMKTYSWTFDNFPTGMVGMKNVLDRVLNELTIDHEDLYVSDNLVEITCRAREKTWNHSRRKRRLHQRIASVKSDLNELSEAINRQKCEFLPSNACRIDELITKLTTLFGKSMDSELLTHKIHFSTLKREYERGLSGFEEVSSEKKRKVDEENGDFSWKKSKVDVGDVGDSMEMEMDVVDEPVLEFRIFVKRIACNLTVDFIKYSDKYDANTLYEAFQAIVNQLKDLK